MIDERRVRSALATIHKYGAEAWRVAGGAAALPDVAGCVHASFDEGTPEHEAVWVGVKAACDGLHAPYNDVALAYFGYPFATRASDGAVIANEPELRSPKARKTAAAQLCGLKDVNNFVREVKRNLRVYGSRTFKSYEELILCVTAESLVHQESPATVDAPPVEFVDIRAAYRQTEASELADLGFFQRKSTIEYINDIAALATTSDRALTIYAGSGVSADIAEPLRSEFMERLLAKALESAPALRHLEGDQRILRARAISERVSRTYPTSYLGSIVRELSRQAQQDAPPRFTGVRRQEERLGQDIKTLLDAGYVPGSFLARAIAACAFALRRAGVSVEVLTSNYDDILIDAAAHIRTPLYLPGELDRYRFVRDHSAERDDTDKSLVLNSTDVLITHVNGTLDEPDVPLVIGEGDFFADYGDDLRPGDAHSSWRRDLMAAKLANTTCLFVGSTVTDPDVLEHLAVSKHQNRKYALVLAPDGDVRAARPRPDDLSGPSRATAVADEQVVRDLIAQRFLHLGVVPVIADHPTHIPQFLREVALRVLQGDAYRSYPGRARLWWAYWAKAFGYGGSAELAGVRNKALQEHWHSGPLREALKRIEREMKKTKTDDERVVVEVWLRNPQQRELTLWARSDSLWLDASTAHHASLTRHSGYIAQSTFEEGQTQRSPMNPSRGQWRFCWSMPLILQEEPWYHLPVGVLNVLSDVPGDESDKDGNITRVGKLARIAHAEIHGREPVADIEDFLAETMLRELDPRTSTWPDRPSWKPAQTASRGKKKASRTRPA